MSTAIINQPNRQLTTVEQKKAELIQGLTENHLIVESIPEKYRGPFKEAFMEFYNMDYLMKSVSMREVIRFCANIARTGLSLNPGDKETYIVPFDTKVGETKIMIPQVIIPLNGIQEIAYRKQFFLRLYEVYNFEGTYASELDMPRELQAKLNTMDPNWVDSHFIGFDVVLVDLTNELPEQKKFVEKSYLESVTNQIKGNFKIQNWRHKAVRRAYGDFMIPRARKLEEFEAIEYENDKMLEMYAGGVSSISEQKQLIAPSDNPLEALKNAVETLKKGLNFEVRDQDGKKIAFLDNKASYSVKAELKKLGFNSKQVDGEWTMQKDVTKEFDAEKALNNKQVSKPQQASDSLFPKEELSLELLGLTSNDKKIGNDTYEIVQGNTTEVEDKLIQLGFSKNGQGIFMREKQQ